MALNLNYTPNKLVDITTLTEDQWLDWRRKGIGGSDVAVALNSSPYRTARDLYYDKIGVVMADEGPDKSITFQIGHLLEDVVAQIFAKKTGLSVFEDHWMVPASYFPVPDCRCRPVRYASGWSKGHPRMQNRAL